MDAEFELEGASACEKLLFRQGGWKRLMQFMNRKANGTRERRAMLSERSYRWIRHLARTRPTREDAAERFVHWIFWMGQPATHCLDCAADLPAAAAALRKMAVRKAGGQEDRIFAVESDYQGGRQLVMFHVRCVDWLWIARKVLHLGGLAGEPWGRISCRCSPAPLASEPPLQPNAGRNQPKDTSDEFNDTLRDLMDGFGG
jgi:hypothetical protein